MQWTLKRAIIGAASAICFSLVVQSQALAQWTLSLPPPTQTAAYFANDNISREVADSLESEIAQPSQSWQQRATPQERANTLTYAPSKARTRSNLAAFVDRSRAIDPAAAAQLERALASDDVLGQVGGVFDQFGLDRNNVAHAYALYWVVYWGLANRVSDPPSYHALQAVAAQAERGFAGNADFGKMDNAQKQQTSEDLMILTALLDALSEQTKSDPELARKVATAALEGSRKSGLDLDKMTLTENGFVPATKKRSDASDAAPGEEQALASVDRSETETGLSTTNMALIAAAGGAGLAGVFLFGKAMGKKG